MCLEIVMSTEFEAVEGEGWKAFNPGLKGIYYNYTVSYPTNKWITDTGDYMIKSYDGSRMYPPGFHLFTKYNDAVIWSKIHNVYDVYKIRYKGIVARGFTRAYGGELEVVVCKEMLILLLP